MLRHPDYTRARLKALSATLYGRIYPATQPAEQILVGPPCGRIPRAEALGLDFRPARLGEFFGPLWTTFWFRIQAVVPADWEGGRVDLLWNSRSEATLWLQGQTAQGLNHEPSRGSQRPCRGDAVLRSRAVGGERLEFEVEMACNDLFGKPAQVYKTLSPFVLEQCEIARFDQAAWDLYHDFSLLQELEADPKSGLEPAWAGELLAELNRFANLYDPQRPEGWGAARQVLSRLYERKNGSQGHQLSAIGHAHIDTAWLWPLAETWRKCERTFSSQVAYMDLYPDYRFACSQACQYEEIKRRNPDLYRRIREKVRGGQFVPVGGTWIEPDCNLPSGESLCRQFLFGQRFFREEFGSPCREFWNPDVFGYNAQLPQLMRQAGITRFLTQKLSWNRFNKPRHHTFVWEGLDGSEVLAHFPPADTYNSMASVSEVCLSARNYKDHDRSRHSLLLFGYGDGGGGPTKAMLETLARLQDLQGVPRTRMRSSAEFFELLEGDCSDRARMVGELYFEYHRGTYTTQAATKRNNRKNEFLLHDLEFLALCARRERNAAYPTAELERLWKLLLLNQFHDIIPGSSIGEVYVDAERQHAEIRATGQALREQALAVLLQARPNAAGQAWIPVNTTAFCRQEVAQRPDGVLAFVQAQPYAIGEVCEAPEQVQAREQADRTVLLENGSLRAVLGADGSLLSLVEKASGREALAGPANRFLLYDDIPTQWDAWDIDPFHLETERPCADATRLELRQAPLRGEVVFERAVGEKSRLRQTIRLEAGARRLEFHTEVDWQERQKLLKVAFPVAIRAMNATYEMQFGDVERPTHYNTPYDLARYEVPGHKWADLSEHGFGVALLSESKYGFSTHGHTLRMSLLRAPVHPDPRADIGRHQFAYALLPHQGGWREGRVVAEAFSFNAPLLWGQGPRQSARSFFSVDDPNLVLDTVKKAEEGEGVVLRLYEAHGARGTARLRSAWPLRAARVCNILEEEQGEAEVRDGAVRVEYRPHQVITLRLD